jgi:hypothetical protein
MNAHAPLFADSSRANIQRYIVRRLRSGGGTRPDLLLLEDRGQQAVMKDYRASSWLLRCFLGPWLIRREERIYRVLSGTPGIPRIIRCPDTQSILVEHIQGRSCADYPDGALPLEFFDRLLRVVKGIHARGVVHCDLKNRSNIVVTDDLRPYIVDFASAFTRQGRLGPLRRLLFERFRMDDLRAVVKARLLVARVGTPADADFAFHRGPAERMVRAVRDGARWLFRLLAGG